MKLLGRSHRTALTVIAASAVLVPALAACGSSASSSSSPSAEATSASASASASMSSGSGAAPVLANGEAPADRTITVTKAALTPATLTIAKGQNVSFKAGEKGVYGVKVGGLDGVTVTGGLVETYDFPEAGEYQVEEEISGNTAVIIVK